MRSIMRSTSSVYYLEYLQSSGGGRYRAEKDSGGLGDILDFTNPLGTPPLTSSARCRL